jgi:multiple sugar transport system ATP-binding protein
VAAIELEKVSKVYPDGTRAVDALDLAIAEGEFMVLVGPSGCGKTTALRMIAGLEEISEGTITIGDRVVNDLPAKDRDIAMVFQTYALYPHMSVRENLAFGLRLRRLPKDEIGRRVQDAARTLALEEYLDRKPRALSGGQRQRVAMGRAIVREPAAYLMDEPLSNLDAKLRVQMRAEIHKLQRTLDVTTVYVTHDQTEAMTMGDRVAVMKSGRLQQVDTPEHVYEHPANQFVAGFIGSPAMNMITATVRRAGNDVAVEFGGHRLVVDPELVRTRPGLLDYAGRTVVLGIRPESFEDAEFAQGASGGRIDVVTSLREALGSEVLVHFPVSGLDAGGDPAAPDPLEALAGEASAVFVARVHPRTRARDGQPLQLTVDTKRLHFFDPESGDGVYERAGRTAPVELVG